MSRRSALATLTSAATLAGAQAPVRPNILFLLPDQVRPQDLSCNGGQNVATPHMDRLAREGVSFPNAFSTCPLCTPYRSMLLSGRYPTHTGILINWLESNPRDPSMAHVLRAAGYGTAYIGKWHLNAGKMKHDGLFMSQEARELEAASNYVVRPKVEQQYIRRNPEPEFVPPGPRAAALITGLPTTSIRNSSRLITTAIRRSGCSIANTKPWARRTSPSST